MYSTNQISKEFRLKRTRLNEEFLAFLRVFSMMYYKGGPLSELMVTIPSSIEYELFVLKFSLMILKEV
jgi:hypothetical protein